MHEDTRQEFEVLTPAIVSEFKFEASLETTSLGRQSIYGGMRTAA